MIASTGARIDWKQPAITVLRTERIAGATELKTVWTAVAIALRIGWIAGATELNAVSIVVADTSPANALAGVPVAARFGRWEENLEPLANLDRFLASVERRALRIAEFAIGNRDDAMDIVQDAMLQLVGRYAQRGPDEWGPLFHRILQNRIRDSYRRAKTRHRWLSWLRPGVDDEDPIANIPDPHAAGPADLAVHGQAGEALELALSRLPYRQQQAFLLRAWEGLDVAETAAAMNCSEGSVKTHFSRAVHTLREQLEGHWS